jgi:quinol monooxygenase YgiN
MSEVVVVARGRIKPGKEAAAEAAFREVIPPTHDESACRRYALHRALEDRQTFVMIERWESRQSLDTHLATQHVQTLFAKLADLVEAPPEILVLEPLSDESGDKGRL